MPAATETKRPIAHRCRHNRDTEPVVLPIDRKTSSVGMLIFTAERPQGLGSRSIEPGNPIGSTMLDDESGGTGRADVHGHSSSKIESRLPRLRGLGPDWMCLRQLVAHPLVAVQAPVCDGVVEAVREKLKIRTGREHDGHANDAIG